MQPRSLNQVLRAQVQLYLDQDNKESETPVFGFFSNLATEQGRTRARDYFADTLGNMRYSSDFDLLQKVWKDLAEDGCLSGSKQLRQRLYEGLISYYEITEDALKKVGERLRANTKPIIMGTQGGTIVVPQVTPFQIYREALSTKLGNKLSPHMNGEYGMKELNKPS